LNKPIDAFASAPVALPSFLAAPASSAPPVGSGWGNMFALKLGEWNCSICTSKNPKEAAKCMACETPVRGKVGGEGGGQGQSAVPAAAAGYLPKFSFGAPNADDKPAPASSGGFTFGAPKVDNKPVHATGGFTIGEPKADDKKEDKSTPCYYYWWIYFWYTQGGRHEGR